MIYLTGASGYLGQQIMALDPRVVPVPRGELEQVRGQVVIHAAWPTPRTEADAQDARVQEQGIAYTARLMAHEPRFVVFVGTRAAPSPYTVCKDVAADLCRPCRVLQFPGLFGPPRKDGLMYRMFRAVLRSEGFNQPNEPIPDWTAMRVEYAANRCLDVAFNAQWSVGEGLPPVRGTTVCRDNEFEDWLAFCREDT